MNKTPNPALAILHSDRGPLGLLLLEDPYASDLAAASPYVASRVVDGCTVERLVYEGDAALEGPMVAAAQALVADGARAITGNCGFMIRHQAAVRNAVDVPVLLSSLLLAPMLLACLGGINKLGVVTASLPSMSDDLLKEAGVIDADRIVMGDLGDKPALKSAFLDCTAEPDSQAIERETLEVAREIVSKNPDVGMILLECTALPGFAAKIQEAINLPVFDIVSLVDMFVEGFDPAKVRGLM